MNRIVGKISTASKVARQKGFAGLYETFMYRYFWPIGMKFSRNAAKHWEEIRYWKRQAKSGQLENSWYQDLFTTPFGLTVADYDQKRILDIGCGPRGSLEWADNASERVGLDPLVEKYRSLNIDLHAMSYVNARSEAIPFDDDYFDFVSCINALDHVDDVKQTLQEIIRVLKPGGCFLLMVDIGHDPTLSEPHTLNWNLLDHYSDTCETLINKQFEQLGSAAQSVTRGAELDASDLQGREGVLLAMLRKR